mmetsp:Transcript_137078/g.273403  ORF Transcript_137078/g.273403 Transcript_137078/m.273403 type:complete len:209 (-) Transcript_137078:329-955(-)
MIWTKKLGLVALRMMARLVDVVQGSHEDDDPIRKTGLLDFDIHEPARDVEIALPREGPLLQSEVLLGKGDHLIARHIASIWHLRTRFLHEHVPALARLKSSIVPLECVVEVNARHRCWQVGFKNVGQVKNLHAVHLAPPRANAHVLVDIIGATQATSACVTAVQVIMLLMVPITAPPLSNARGAVEPRSLGLEPNAVILVGEAKAHEP